MGRRYDTMRHSAFEAKGRDWKNLIVGWEFTRMALPWLAIAAALGALGWALHGAWVMITADAPDTGDSTVPVGSTVSLGAVPGWVWIAGLLCAAALAFVLRPGRLPTSRIRRARVAQVFAIVILFAGVVGVGLAQVGAGG